MPSSYTTNLVIEKPATGEQAGIWGTTANQSYDFIDMGIDGNVSVGLSASSYDLRTDERALSVGRNKVIVFTGALSNEGNVTISPNTAKKIYYVVNHTSGNFGLTFKQGTGPTFHLLNGRSAVIYADGLGGAASVAGALDDFQVNSLLVQTNLIIGTGGNIQWSGPATFNQPVTFQGLATFSVGATFSSPVTFNLGADQPNDLYYRSSTGSLARLPITPTSGYVLTATPSGLSWAAPPGAAIGMTVAGGAGNQILYVDLSQHMAQNAQLQFVPNVGLGLGMVPTRALSVGGGLSSSAVIQIDSPLLTGNNTIGRALNFTTASAARWSLFLTGEPEAGSGSAGGGVVGGNCILASTNDAQTQNPVSFVAYRTGRMSIGNVYANFDSQLAVRNTSAASFIQIWQKADGTTVASLDANGNFLAASVPGGGGGGGGLTLDGNGRLDIHGTVSGHPLGTIHLGADSVGGQPNPSIVLEGAAQTGNPILGGNSMRMYVKTAFGAPKFVIQFAIGGVAYYAHLDLQADNSDGIHDWKITTTAQ